MNNKLKSRKATPNGNIKYINFVKNWLHQAFSYMDKGEKCFRVFIVILEITILSLISYHLFALPLIYLLTANIIIVHTFNWLTNGLFWAITIFAIPGLTNPGEKKTVQYLNEMEARLRKCNSISGLVIFGSVTRGKWHDRSDIDIRILRNSGFVNLIVSNLVTMQERLIAFFSKQPMDLYLADNIIFFNKMRDDEQPIFLIKKGEILKETYPNIYETNLNKLSHVDVLN